jgi:hypothetical protein
MNSLPAASGMGNVKEDDDSRIVQNYAFGLRPVLNKVNI